MSDITITPGQIWEFNEGRSFRISRIEAAREAVDGWPAVGERVYYSFVGGAEEMHTGAYHMSPAGIRETARLVTDSPTPAQDHGPLAAHLSDRTLAKVLSRPAHVPLSEMKSTRVFGFNVVTISPQGIPGGPRLDGVVSRQRAQDELDELEPFMVDGWTTVMVELREVTS